MTKRIITNGRFLLSFEGACLQEKDMNAVKKLPSKIAKLFIEGKASGKRAVSKIQTIGGKELWADRVTGTLYGMDGLCKSSPVLRIEVAS